MKLLVAGAGGLLGAHLVRALLREGDSVRALVPEGDPAEALRGLDVEVVAGPIEGFFAGCEGLYLLAGGDREIAAARHAEIPRMVATVEVSPPATVVTFAAPVGAWDAVPSPVGRLILDVLQKKTLSWRNSPLELVDAEDVARGLILAFRKGRPGDRLHLAGEASTLRRTARLVADVGGVRPPIFPLPLPVGVIPPADDRRAREELGWQRGPVRPAFEKAIVWFHARGRLDAPAR